MRLECVLAVSVLALCLPGVVARAGDDPSGVAFCDGLAAAIRAADGPVPGMSPGEDRPPPGVQAIPFSPVPDDWNSRATDLIRRYHPDEALAKALRGTAPSGRREAVLPGGVHVFVDVGGTANCRTFLFFETPAKGPAHLLPDLPLTGSDLQALCWDSDGLPVARDGVPGLLRRYASASDYSYSIGLLLLDRRRWRPECRVEARFGTEYEAASVTLPPGSPISREELAGNAKRIASPVIQDAYLKFSEVPAARQADLERLTGVMMSAMPFAAHPRAYGPLVLGGQVYWATLEHQGVGWRENRDELLQLYTLTDGKPAPAGAVEITARRGRLFDLRAIAGAW